MHGAVHIAQNIKVENSEETGTDGTRKSPSKKAPRNRSPRSKSPGTTGNAEPALIAHLAGAVGLTNLKIIRDRFVFDARIGTFHRISETAAFLLAGLQRQTPLVDLVTHYAERYAIPRAVAERDLELFLNDLAVAADPLYGQPPPTPARSRTFKRASEQTPIAAE